MKHFESRNLRVDRKCQIRLKFGTFNPDIRREEHFGAIACFDFKERSPGCHTYNDRCD